MRQLDNNGTFEELCLHLRSDEGVLNVRLQDTPSINFTPTVLDYNQPAMRAPFSDLDSALENEEQSMTLQEKKD